VSWITETGQLLTAVGVGSILGSLITQFVSRSGEWRALRAKVHSVRRRLGGADEVS
jgi:hypothetical protein